MPQSIPQDIEFGHWATLSPEEIAEKITPFLQQAPAAEVNNVQVVLGALQDQSVIDALVAALFTDDRITTSMLQSNAVTLPKLGSTLKPRVLLEDRDVSSSIATVDFDDIFTDDFDLYVIETLRIRPTTDNRIWQMRVGTGSSYIATGTYSYSSIKNTTTNNATAGTEFGITQNLGVGSNVREGAHGTMLVFDPTNASKRTRVHLQGMYGNTGLVPINLNFAGIYNNAEAHTSFRYLFSSSSNTEEARIKVYGIPD